MKIIYCYTFNTIVVCEFRNLGSVSQLTIWHSGLINMNESNNIVLSSLLFDMLK